MNDRENRRLQMFVRAREFGVAHSRDFADDGVGKGLFTTLTTTISEIENHAESEVSGKGHARQGTTTRSLAREAVREDIEAISQTAMAMSNNIPGLDDNFQLPPRNNDQLLLNAAHAFVTEATPLRAQFIAHELPSDFLDNLSADISALETAINNHSNGVEGHVSAGAGIDEAIDRGIETVRRLDVVVRNRYSNNVTVLAEWTSASHTQREPRSKPTTPTPPPPPSDGAGSTPPLL